MVEDSVFVWYLLLKGLEICLKAKLHGRGLQNVLVSKSDFFSPLVISFFLLAQRQDSSWTPLTEVVLITTLENVLWLWKSSWLEVRGFSGADRAFSVLTPAYFILTKHWWATVTQRGLDTGHLPEVLISHNAATPQWMAAGCCCKSCIWEITTMIHFVCRHQNVKSFWQSWSQWTVLGDGSNKQINARKAKKANSQSIRSLLSSVLTQCCPFTVVQCMNSVLSFHCRLGLMGVDRNMNSPLRSN